MNLKAHRPIHLKVHLTDWTARLTIKALNGFEQKQITLKDEYEYIMLVNFIGHIFRTFS